VTANLHQNGTDVTGDFDLLEVCCSGGSVKGTVETATGDETLKTFRVSFEPDDLGDPFSVDAKITSPDGDRFEGTFVFDNGVVGRGNATFTRCPGTTVSACLSGA
jgi:hypothetical protein